MTTTDVQPAATGGVLSRTYRWVTIGLCMVVTLVAFESLAVSTVMPVVSAELNGAALYALSFAGPLSVSVIGMVAAGGWADRSGPLAPLMMAVVLFVVGLVVAGSATVMGMLVVGRLVHGLGGGALIVTVYVVVAKAFPAHLRVHVFTGFAAAWVIPSLIGPVVAGLVADSVGWRWVFLGVIGLMAIAMAMVLPTMWRQFSPRHVPGAAAPADVTVPERWRPASLGWAVLTAAGVLTLTLSAESDGALRWILPVLAVAVIFFGIRPLLPVGTLRAGRGLPSLILARGVISGAYFGTEIYLPYLLTGQYHLTPVLAGLALTGGGVSWSVASMLQGRFGARLSNEFCLRMGMALLATAIAITLVISAFHLPPVWAIVGWIVAGAGMGLMYPRISTAALAHAPAGKHGFTSSAVWISDSMGSAVTLAAIGIVFTLFPAGGSAPFIAAFGLTLLVALLGMLLPTRIKHLS